MKPHVKQKFLLWFEQKLEPEERQRIDVHLQSCTECGDYYRKMSLWIGPPDLLSVPQLKADPNLVMHLRRSPSGTHEIGPLKISVWINWSLRSAAVLAAIVTGIVLGGTWSEANTDTDEQQIAAAFYEAFSQQGPAESWQNFVNTAEEDTHED